MKPSAWTRLFPPAFWRRAAAGALLLLGMGALLASCAVHSLEATLLKQDPTPTATANPAAPLLPPGSPLPPGSLLPPGLIPFQTLANAAPLGDRPPAPYFAVLQPPVDWQSLSASLPAEAVKAIRDAKLPEGSLLVIAYAGVQGSSGYQVAIQGLWQEGAQVKIRVALTSPSPAQIVEPARTMPYFIVRFSKDQLSAPAPSEFVFVDPQDRIFYQQRSAFPE